MQQVLLLNSSYEPLHICSWKRALVLVIKGKAVAVEQKDAEIRPGMPMPLVIRLLYYVKIPHKDIPLTRKNIMHRDQYTCQYCGKTQDLTIDHVVPRSRGGKDTWNNTVVACLKCNVVKGNRTPNEANMFLKKKPTHPVGFIQFELSKQQHQSRRQMDQWRKYLFESL